MYNLYESVITAYIPVSQSLPVNPVRHSHLYPSLASGMHTDLGPHGLSEQFTTGRFMQRRKYTLQYKSDSALYLT